MKENEQAVEYYVQARGVLQQHADIPSLKAIASECDSVMGALRKRLKENISAQVCKVAAHGCCGTVRSDLMPVGCLYVCLYRMRKRRARP